MFPLKAAAVMCGVWTACCFFHAEASPSAPAKPSRVRLKGQISPKCELTTESYRAETSDLAAKGNLGFNVDCNTGAEITVRAAHGVLQHQSDVQGSPPAQVAYDTELFIESLGERPLMKASGEKLTGQGVTKGTGGAAAYKSTGKLLVTPRGVAHPENLPAGRYTDQVTITITAQGA